MNVVGPPPPSTRIANAFAITYSACSATGTDAPRARARQAAADVARAGPGRYVDVRASECDPEDDEAVQQLAPRRAPEYPVAGSAAKAATPATAPSVPRPQVLANSNISTHTTAVIEDRRADQGDRQPDQAGIRGKLSDAALVPWLAGALIPRPALTAGRVPR